MTPLLFLQWAICGSVGGIVIVLAIVVIIAVFRALVNKLKKEFKANWLKIGR